MDILAHALWAGAGVALARHRWRLTARDAAVAAAAAALPDLLHAMPVLAWALLGTGSWEGLRDYVLATPGTEPTLPAPVEGAAHHLHCVMHSALIGVPVGVLLAWRWPVLKPALWGWWSHIAIDVFTHSADFYPSPVFYPLTRDGFHGVAWNTPSMLWLNYALLATVGAWLLVDARLRRRGRGPDATPRPP